MMTIQLRRENAWSSTLGFVARLLYLLRQKTSWLAKGFLIRCNCGEPEDEHLVMRSIHRLCAEEVTKIAEKTGTEGKIVLDFIEKYNNPGSTYIV